MNALEADGPGTAARKARDQALSSDKRLAISGARSPARSCGGENAQAAHKHRQLKFVRSSLHRITKLRNSRDTVVPEASGISFLVSFPIVCPSVPTIAMLRPAIRSAPRLLRAARPHLASSSRRLASTAAPAKKGTWKGTAARWGAVAAAVYWYNTSPLFADEAVRE